MSTRMEWAAPKLSSKYATLIRLNKFFFKFRVWELIRHLALSLYMSNVYVYPRPDLPHPWNHRLPFSPTAQSWISFLTFLNPNPLIVHSSWGNSVRSSFWRIGVETLNLAKVAATAKASFVVLPQPVTTSLSLALISCPGSFLFQGRHTGLT